MSRAGKPPPVQLRAVPDSAPQDSVVRLNSALGDIAIKLRQIRAIADLIDIADPSMLYDDAVKMAAFTICDLASDGIELAEEKPT